jgi:hypothetical protein
MMTHHTRFSDALVFSQVIDVLFHKLPLVFIGILAVNPVGGLQVNSKSKPLGKTLHSVG